jgi:hypothetical protein
MGAGGAVSGLGVIFCETGAGDRGRTSTACDELAGVGWGVMGSAISVRPDSAADGGGKTAWAGRANAKTVKESRERGKVWKGWIGRKWWDFFMMAAFTELLWSRRWI